MQVKPAYPGALYSELKQYPKKPKPSDLEKEWFIYFKYFHKGKWVPIKRKGELNHAPSFKEKLLDLNALKKAILLHLEDGWNPKTKTFEKQTEEFEAVFDANLTLVKALDFGLKQCDVAETTKRNYTNCIKKIKTAIQLLQFQYLPISEVKRKHVRVILEKCRTIYKWSNQEFNKNLSYLQGVLSRLEQFEIIEYNPAHKIKTLEVIEKPSKFIPYTDEEKKIIHDHLFLHHYGYYVFFMTGYHTGLRPYEILALKLPHIDMQNRHININPDRQRKNSKTKKIRQIPINDHLYPILREWIEGADPTYYVFGSVLHGKFGAKHPDFFRPSPNRIKRDTVTKLWQSIVIKGLGINKLQYAYKHTGTDDRLKAGLELQVIQDLYGHTTEFMTKRYQTVLREIQTKELNLKAPAFIQNNKPV